MSVEHMSRVLNRSVPINPTQRLVLLILADGADMDDVCHISMESIVHRTRIEPRTVQRAIRQLQMSGLILVKTWVCANARKVNQPNLYELVLMDDNKSQNPAEWLRHHERCNSR